MCTIETRWALGCAYLLHNVVYFEHLSINYRPQGRGSPYKTYGISDRNKLRATKQCRAGHTPLLRPMM